VSCVLISHIAINSPHNRIKKYALGAAGKRGN
jgi:hypothetical protein